ncbi:spore germination protein KB [Neobacillus niacini]|uniref:GerAB/ArcD/ProY family transporter n=1 Tax=Neobacillus niacini TaxID=86668 RepID=UPI0027887AD5|nr:GerAB/ArcD/ProY family transporter [Neobacillus niacini]MDQ1005145.1 spore germination protein KB [Neobacillus niacini]
MEKERISPGQLFALMVLFTTGISLVYPIGISWIRSVWLSVLIALFGAVVLFQVIVYFHCKYPDMTLSGYSRKILGKYIGWPISLLYIPYFIHTAARNLRDGGDLLVTALYDQTPLLIINTIMIIAVVYVLYKGIEVFARIAEIYLLILIVLGVLGNLLVLFSGIIDVKNLLPIVEKGWRPILHSAYPKIFIFPFAEMFICFTTILPHLNKSKLGKRTGVMAIIFSGLLLTFTHAVEISVLGSNMYSRSTFPLLVTISKVNEADFLQRVDAIVILTLIIGVFFKIAIFSYAAVSVSADLFKILNQEKLVLPIGIVVLYISMIVTSNWTEQVQQGTFLITFVYPLFCVVIPVLLLVVDLIRKQFGPQHASINADEKSK